MSDDEEDGGNMLKEFEEEFDNPRELDAMINQGN